MPPQPEDLLHPVGVRLSILCMPVPQQYRVGCDDPAALHRIGEKSRNRRIISGEQKPGQAMPPTVSVGVE
ncbi:hypothetical protein D3C72_1872710 [compost metagenome]